MYLENKVWTKTRAHAQKVGLRQTQSGSCQENNRESLYMNGMNIHKVGLGFKESRWSIFGVQARSTLTWDRGVFDYIWPPSELSRGGLLLC